MNGKEGLGTRRELERRLEQVPAQDTLRGFFVGAALKVLQAQGDAATWALGFQASGGERFVPFFSYPVAMLLRTLYVGAEALGPRHGGFEGALRYFGSRAAPDFLSSPVGRGLVSLSLRDPKRVLTELPSVFQLVMRHGHCEVEWTGPRSGVLWLKGNRIPHPYFEGALGTLFEALRHPDARVQGRALEAGGSALSVSW